MALSLPWISLNSLVLLNPNITDAGLPDLTVLKSLAYFDLGASQISDAGRAELEHALPKCLIRRERWDVDEKGTLWTEQGSTRRGFHRTH
jgi:hypothetical protein